MSDSANRGLLGFARGFPGITSRQFQSISLMVCCMEPASMNRDQARKRALLLYGGWPEHSPQRAADFAVENVLGDFDVVRSEDLAVLCDEVLARFDLLVPVWTFGELAETQASALFRAVSRGLGLVAWHGFASAFLACRAHKHLLGGQFVAHPGGNSVTYDIHFHRNDPLVDGLNDFTLTSEQYYMLIDPAVKVIASTTIRGEEMPWLRGVNMPVAWTRSWGKGRVFYCALGHTVDVLEHPSITTLLHRAGRWSSQSALNAESLQSR